MAGDKPAAAQVRLVPAGGLLGHFESPQLCGPTNALIPCCPLNHGLPWLPPSSPCSSDSQGFFWGPQHPPVARARLRLQASHHPAGKEGPHRRRWEAEPSIARWWHFPRTSKASCQPDGLKPFLASFCNLLWDRALLFLLKDTVCMDTCVVCVHMQVFLHTEVRGHPRCHSSDTIYLLFRNRVSPWPGVHWLG